MKNEYFQNVDSTRKMYKYMNRQLTLQKFFKSKSHFITKEDEMHCNKAKKKKTDLGLMSYKLLCNV